jgi:hypothetical protein
MRRLAWINAGGGLELDADALSVLKTIPGPLCAIGMTACYEGESQAIEIEAENAESIIWMHVYQASGGKAQRRTVVVLCAKTRNNQDEDSDELAVGLPLVQDMNQAQLGIVAFLMLICSTIVHSRCVFAIH